MKERLVYCPRFYRSIGPLKESQDGVRVMKRSIFRCTIVRGETRILHQIASGHCKYAMSPTSLAEMIYQPNPATLNFSCYQFLMKRQYSVHFLIMPVGVECNHGKN